MTAHGIATAAGQARHAHLRRWLQLLRTIRRCVRRSCSPGHRCGVKARRHRGLRGGPVAQRAAVLTSCKPRAGTACRHHRRGWRRSGHRRGGTLSIPQRCRREVRCAHAVPTPRAAGRERPRPAEEPGLRHSCCDRKLALEQACAEVSQHVDGRPRQAASRSSDMRSVRPMATRCPPVGLWARCEPLCISDQNFRRTSHLS